MQSNFEYGFPVSPPQPGPRAEDVWDQLQGMEHTMPIVSHGLTQLVPRHAEFVLEQAMPPATHALPAAPAALAPPAPPPLRETRTWFLCKHAAQLLLLTSVLVFVLEGGERPAMALSWVATGLLLVGATSVADRRRFLDHQPDFEIVASSSPQVSDSAPVTVPASVHLAPQFVAPHPPTYAAPTATASPAASPDQRPTVLPPFHIDSAYAAMPAHLDVT